MDVFVRKMWNYERRVPLTGAAAIRTWREQRPCSTDHTSTHNRTNELPINEINFRINLSWKPMFRSMLINWTTYVMFYIFILTDILASMNKTWISEKSILVNNSSKGKCRLLFCKLPTCDNIFTLYNWKMLITSNTMKNIFTNTNWIKTQLLQ